MKKIDTEETMRKKIDTKGIAEGHQIAIEKKEDKMDTEKGKKSTPVKHQNHRNKIFLD